MFATTFPIIFTYIHLFSEMEAALFLAALFGLVYFNCPQPEPKKERISYKNWYWFFYSALVGDMALWQAFWPFFLFINGLLIYIDYRIAALTYTIASWKTVHGMVFLPIIWWFVSVWRCTRHSQHRVFGALARTMTLYLFVELALRFYISTQHPNTLFNCRLLSIHYGDCL